MSAALLSALVATASAGEQPQRGDTFRDERIEKLERLNRELLEKVEAISRDYQTIARDYQTIAGQNAELKRRLDEVSGRVSVAPAPGLAPATGGGASGASESTERTSGRRTGGGSYGGGPSLQGIGFRNLAS